MKKEKAGLTPNLDPQQAPDSSVGKSINSSAYFPLNASEPQAEESLAQPVAGPSAPNISTGWSKAILGMLALAAVGVAAVAATRSSGVREFLAAPVSIGDIRDRAAGIIRSKAVLEPAVQIQSNAGSWNAVLRNFTGPRTVDSDCRPCMTAARAAALERLPSGLADEVRKGERQLYEVALTPNAVSNEVNTVDVFLDGEKLQTLKLAVETPRAVIVPLRVGKPAQLVLRSTVCTTGCRGVSPCKGMTIQLANSFGAVGGEPTGFDDSGKLQLPLLVPDPSTRVVSYSNVARTVMSRAPSALANTAGGANEVDYSAPEPVPVTAPAPVKVCPTTPTLDD